MFWNCLTMFSLKRWGNLAETSIELVLEYICWNDEDVWLKQVLKLSYNIFDEVMKISGYDEFWKCITMFSLKRWGNLADTSSEIVWKWFRWSDEEIRLRRVLKSSYGVFVEAMREFEWDKFENCLTTFPLKWWGNPFKTCFGIVLQCFRWNDEGIRLRQVLRLS